MAVLFSYESAIFAGVLPRAYDGGGLTITIGWAATSATTGDVIWNAEIAEVDDDVDDVDTDLFAAANASAAVAAPSVSGEISYDTITFTDGADMDSLSAGKMFLLRITRDADNASDTMSGDAELFSIEIVET